MAVAPLIIGGIQAGIGAIQRRASKRRREKAMEALDYDIPSGITEQVQLAKERASRTGLPGEDVTRSRVDSDIAEAVSKGETVSQTSSDVLGMYSDLYGKKMDINQNILEKGAQYKSSNELDLMKSMGLMAEAENQQFYYNRMVPFLSNMGMAGQESAGGAANIAGGLQTAYSGWMDNFMADQYKDIYGQNGVGQTSPPTQGAFTPKQDPSLGIEPWMTNENNWPAQPPQDQGVYNPYNVGHPNREQMTRPNTYGNNYPAY